MGFDGRHTQGHFGDVKDCSELTLRQGSVGTRRARERFTGLTLPAVCQFPEAGFPQTRLTRLFAVHWLEKPPKIEPSLRRDRIEFVTI
jgi:hypothetical protein